MEPLQRASREGSIDALNAALAKNPRILSGFDKMPLVDTPLHIAASAGHTRFALQIMSLKPSFARKLNPDGLSPIHVALLHDFKQMAICFVEAEPGLVRVKGKGSITPLDMAVRDGDVDLLRRFLSVCPESIRDVTFQGESALVIALDFCKLEVFQILLDKLGKDADEEASKWNKRVVNYKDLGGNTILHIASSTYQVQAIQMLVAYNRSNPGMLEVDARNSSNQTAREIAEFCHHRRILPLLNQLASPGQFHYQIPKFCIILMSVLVVFCSIFF